ncbi:MAG: CPBP family intramembrane metalloprotease [Sedimentisphaerales bacterium]|nr:CPBP family intramembrane metalloprotease [Sedimentisphaerales bacterium]
MNIPENIKEIIGAIRPEDIFIYFSGFILLAIWLIRTSFGKKALENSIPRRNGMPIFLPLALTLAVLLSVGLLNELSLSLFKDLQKWKQVLISELISLSAGLVSIGLLLFIIKIYFVRGFRGFGLNIKTIPRDFVYAFTYILAIFPLMEIVFWATININKFISGTEYEIPTHQELQNIIENPSILVRLVIATGTIGIIPFLEELLYRGLFQTMIRTNLYYYKHAGWIAIFITSVFFSISHENISHWPILFILGACMGYSYEKSGSLFRPVLIHMLFNASAVLATWRQ